MIRSWHEQRRLGTWLAMTGILVRWGLRWRRNRRATGAQGCALVCGSYYRIDLRTLYGELHGCWRLYALIVHHSGILFNVLGTL